MGERRLDGSYEMISSRESDPSTFAMRHSPGSMVPVRYDPADPTQSAYGGADASTQGASFSAGVGFLVMGALLAWHCSRMVVTGRERRPNSHD